MLTRSTAARIAACLLHLGWHDAGCPGPALRHRVFGKHRIAAEHIGPAPAARLVARAWLDPDFKQLALAEPLTASREVGVDWLEPTGFGTPSDFVAFQILADTPTDQEEPA